MGDLLVEFGVTVNHVLVLPPLEGAADQVGHRPDEANDPMVLLNEILDTEPGLANDSPQGASIQFLVIWDSHLGKRIISAHDNVTTTLPNYEEAKLAQNGDAFLSGELW